MIIILQFNYIKNRATNVCIKLCIWQLRSPLGLVPLSVNINRYYKTVSELQRTDGVETKWCGSSRPWDYIFQSDSISLFTRHPLYFLTYLPQFPIICIYSTILPYKYNGIMIALLCYLYNIVSLLDPLFYGFTAWRQF